MSERDDSPGVRARGEEALGELAQALLDNPLFSRAVGQALGAGERAMAAQRGALKAANLATASDVERLEQRLRSLSGRLEETEDALDEMRDEVSSLRRKLADSQQPADS
jgi:chromosome segregation ATPase